MQFIINKHPTFPLVVLGILPCPVNKAQTQEFNERDAWIGDAIPKAQYIRLAKGDANSQSFWWKGNGESRNLAAVPLFVCPYECGPYCTLTKKCTVHI